MEENKKTVCNLYVSISMHVSETIPTVQESWLQNLSKQQLAASSEQSPFSREKLSRGKKVRSIR